MKNNNFVIPTEAPPLAGEVEGSVSRKLFGDRFTLRALRLDSLRSLGMTNSSGFSFVEIILVVAIISVLGFMATSFYARFYTQNNVAMTTDQITQTLRKAQLYSMSGKHDGQWGIHNTGTSFVMFHGSSYAGRTVAFDETWSINPNITISGLSDIVFTRGSGTPDAAATITISGLNSTRTITLNAQGGISR